jgi:hypothetical protein
MGPVANEPESRRRLHGRETGNAGLPAFRSQIVIPRPRIRTTSAAGYQEAPASLPLARPAKAGGNAL